MKKNMFKSSIVSRIVSGILLLTGIMMSFSLKAQLVVDSLTGPVTPHEINAFKSFVQTIAPPTYGGSNIWVFGSSGKVLEACGLMYEASHDTAILDRMIFYSDAALAGRNDLASAANGGQLATWTGNIDPVWPSSAANVTPAGAGVEQGDVLSHIAYCARLILETPAIWNVTVPIGDPKGYGTTYKARALRYIQECDYVIDNWILPYFIRTTDNNRYYFPGAPNTYMAGKPAPWNQAWMLTNAFVRLVQCHVILNDAPSRVSQYDSIVQPNIDWFFASLTPNTSAAGTACWTWAYQLPTGMEDTNHAAYDCEGLWIAYYSGRYGLTKSKLLPFANTYFDVVMATVTNGRFAGRVDGSTGTGHSGGDTYVRDEYIYLTEFRPEQFVTVGNVEISTGHIASSTPITARLLWEKNRRYTAAATVPAAPSALTATAISGSEIHLTWTDNASNETGFIIETSADTLSWSALTTAAANATGYSNTGLSANTRYYYRIKAANGAGYSAYSNITSATTLAAASTNIALNKPATVSNYYHNSATYNGAKAVDGDITTRWAVDDAITTATLEIDLGGTYTFGRTVTREYQNRVAGYKIQYWNGTSWNDAFTGTTIGATDKTDIFTPVTGSKVRLNILATTGTKGASIYEFAVYGFPTGSSFAAIAGTHNIPVLSVYPNPVVASSRIRYSLKENGRINLVIYNMRGENVATIVNGHFPAGNYEAVFDPAGLPAGAYVVRLTTARQVSTVTVSVTK